MIKRKALISQRLVRRPHRRGRRAQAQAARALSAVSKPRYRSALHRQLSVYLNLALQIGIQSFTYSFLIKPTTTYVFIALLSRPNFQLKIEK